MPAGSLRGAIPDIESSRAATWYCKRYCENGPTKRAARRPSSAPRCASAWACGWA